MLLRLVHTLSHCDSHHSPSPGWTLHGPSATTWGTPGTSGFFLSSAGFHELLNPSMSPEARLAPVTAVNQPRQTLCLKTAELGVSRRKATCTARHPWAFSWPRSGHITHESLHFHPSRQHCLSGPPSSQLPLTL